MIDVIPIVQSKGDEGQNQGCDNRNGGKNGSQTVDVAALVTFLKWQLEEKEIAIYLAFLYKLYFRVTK